MPILFLLLATRLAALDAELTKTYAASKNRAGQQEWLKACEECGDSEECLEAAYLVRIAALRRANGLFARAKPPASVVGRYAETQEICGPSEDEDNENECDATVENFVEIKRGKGNALLVNSELYFHMGHTCTIEKAPAEWVRDELRVAIEDECVLLMRFDASGVRMTDPYGRCKNFACGVRGSFDDLSLPRKTTRKR